MTVVVTGFFLALHASLRGDATDMDGDGYDFAVNEDEVVGNDDL